MGVNFLDFLVPAIGQGLQSYAQINLQREKEQEIARQKTADEARRIHMGTVLRETGEVGADIRRLRGEIGQVEAETAATKQRYALADLLRSDLTPEQQHIEAIEQGLTGVPGATQALINAMRPPEPESTDDVTKRESGQVAFYKGVVAEHTRYAAHEKDMGRIPLSLEDWFGVYYSSHDLADVRRTAMSVWFEPKPTPEHTGIPLRGQPPSPGALPPGRSENGGTTPPPGPPDTTARGNLINAFAASPEADMRRDVAGGDILRGTARADTLGRGHPDFESTVQRIIASEQAKGRLLSRAEAETEALKILSGITR